MKVETLGSFNFDVILCVVCVCDMTQLLQRSMCVCNTKFQPLTHLARVINMLCVYTRLTPWLGAFRYVDRIPVDSEKCSGDAELTKKYKSIDTGCADFSKWEVTNFLNKNLICLFKENKEIPPDVVQSLFFVSRQRRGGPIPCDIWIQIYQTLLFTWLFRWPPGLLIKIELVELNLRLSVIHGKCQ